MGDRTNGGAELLVPAHAEPLALADASPNALPGGAHSNDADATPVHEPSSAPIRAEVETSADRLGAHTNAGPPSEADIAATPVPPARTDAAVNGLVGKLQDGLRDWKYDDVELSRVAAKLREVARALWDEFLLSLPGGRDLERPEFLLCFEPESPRILGHYHNGRNAFGLRCEISLNPRTFAARSEMELAKTTLHELVHAFEDLRGTAPKSHNGYHSKWFRDRALEFGIPCATKYGHDGGIDPNGRFAAWALRRGLTGEPVLLVVPSELSPPRSSKRVAWVCDQTTDRCVTVQVPRGSELVARCLTCGALFRRA